VPVRAAVSVTVKITANTPRVVGVPLITARLLTVVRVNPGGRVAPGSDQV